MAKNPWPQTARTRQTIRLRKSPMTTEEVRKFLQEKGVADTLIAIFQLAKLGIANGEKIVTVGFDKVVTAEKFNHVVKLAGYDAKILNKINHALLIIDLQQINLVGTPD
jgi:hypothetical protein